jgi:hypothetical protein
MEIYLNQPLHNASFGTWSIGVSPSKEAGHSFDLRPASLIKERNNLSYQSGLVSSAIVLLATIRARSISRSASSCSLPNIVFSNTTLANPSAAQAINEESYSALPSKSVVEVLQHVRQNMGDTYPDFIDQFCNSEIQRVILGQTASSGGNEGWSKGNHQQQVRAEKIEADAKFLMLYVNMCLVWPLTLFNLGPVKKPPIWIIQYEPQRDLSAYST